CRACARGRVGVVGPGGAPGRAPGCLPVAPFLPCLAQPCRAEPCLAAPSPAAGVVRRDSNPVAYLSHLPCLALPGPARPSPALPGRALPRLAPPCHGEWCAGT